MSELFEKLEPYDSIGFDLDDTLYLQNDYDVAIYNSYLSRKYGGERGQYLSNKLIEKKQTLPKGYPHLFDDFAVEEQIELDIPELLKYYRTPPLVVLKEKFVLEDIVIRLKELGKFLFICTNGHKRIQENKIASLGINSVFENIYILFPDGNYPMKPSPAIKAKIPIVGRTIFLGDQDIDEEFAKNCGFDFIRINILDYVQR